MYQVSDKFKIAMNENMRTLSLKAVINGVERPVEEFIGVEIEDSINDGDYFTIGEAVSKTCKLKMFYDKNVKEGMTVIPLIGLLVDNIFEYVPQGVFYIDSIARDKKVMTLECFDKMYQCDEEYISSLEYPSSTMQIAQEIAAKLKFEIVGEIPEIIINSKPLGFSNREIIGYIASLNGANARFNKDGKLEFKTFNKIQVDAIDGNSFITFNKDNVITISGVSCLFGDIDIYAGSDSENIVKFENPFMTQEQIRHVLSKVEGLSFTAGQLEYRGNFSYDAGDLITVSDIDNRIYTILLSSNSLNLNGGLNGSINSIGESKEENIRKEHSFSSKKSITELNIKFGKIQHEVKTVEETNSSIQGNMTAIVEKQASLEHINEGFNFAINKIINDGVTTVDNTLVKINLEGISVAKDGDEFSSLQDNRGFYVKSYGQEKSRFDKDGFKTGYGVLQRAQIGHLRFENGTNCQQIHYIEDLDIGGITFVEPINFRISNHDMWEVD